jgi:PBP1b-binding outer membrane lipoprotein LpoB
MKYFKYYLIIIVCTLLLGSCSSTYKNGVLYKKECKN